MKILFTQFEQNSLSIRTSQLEVKISLNVFGPDLFMQAQPTSFRFSRLIISRFGIVSVMRIGPIDRYKKQDAVG